MTEPVRTSRGSWLALLLFAAPWLLYGVALMLQPDDPFAAWHGDTVWPARHFLVHSQGGLVTPIFGYVMIGGVGGLFVGLVLVAATKLVCRLLRVRDRSDLASTLAFVLTPAWAFVLLKAVPQTVTEIDPESYTIDGDIEGEVVDFTLTFRGVVAATTEDQLFALTLNVLGDGSVLLDTMDIIVVVPGNAY